VTDRPGRKRDTLLFVQTFYFDRIFELKTQTLGDQREAIDRKYCILSQLLHLFVLSVGLSVQPVTWLAHTGVCRTAQHKLRQSDK
jgi:hypothetical protein